MPQSHAQVWLHIVFSTKEHRPFLQDEAFRIEMFRMLSHQVKETKCVSVCAGGHVDHVHLLTGLSRTLTIAKLVEKVKSETSKWGKKRPVVLRHCSGKQATGAFSVSHSLRMNVDAYIRNQMKHRAALLYQDEYRRLCAKHGVVIDERYVWD